MAQTKAFSAWRGILNPRQHTHTRAVVTNEAFVEWRDGCKILKKKVKECQRQHITLSFTTRTCMQMAKPQTLEGWTTSLCKGPPSVQLSASSCPQDGWFGRKVTMSEVIIKRKAKLLALDASWLIFCFCFQIPSRRLWFLYKCAIPELSRFVVPLWGPSEISLLSLCTCVWLRFPRGLALQPLKLQPASARPCLCRQQGQGEARGDEDGAYFQETEATAGPSSPSPPPNP